MLTWRLTQQQPHRVRHDGAVSTSAASLKLHLDQDNLLPLPPLSAPNGIWKISQSREKTTNESWGFSNKVVNHGLICFQKTDI